MNSSSISHSASGTSSPLPTPTKAPSTSASPLLFFVALGFGVVFTNLWIIVGVKYCFRYNRRNRALRAQENIGAASGHGNNQNNRNNNRVATGSITRTRRDKRILTFEELNLRFPLTNYRVWANSQSAAASATATSPSTQKNDFISHQAHTSLEKPPKSPIGKGDASDEDEENGQTFQIQPFVSATTANDSAESGDNCAICLDTLEESQFVRGLTCGHAFHGPCLDPWLTARRASCPLCKADYYVDHGPKPEANIVTARRSADDSSPVDSQQQQPIETVTLPRSPPRIWQSDRFQRFSSPSNNIRRWAFLGRIPGRPSTPAQLEAGQLASNTPP